MKISKIKLSLCAVIAIVIAIFAFSSCEMLMSNSTSSDDVENDGTDVSDDADDPDDQPAECKHFWINHTAVTIPTCGTSETGITEVTCKHCGAKDEQISYPYKSHHIDKLTTPAQCGIDGLTVETCRNCNYVKEYVLAALIHDYQLMPVPDGEGAFGFACVHCNDVRSVVSVVTYEDFGAVGDGVTDDYLAIRAAHEAANACGLPVLGRSDATYYIGPVNQTIRIKTDTDWNGARFIFDDHKIPWDSSTLRYTNVFTVTAEEGSERITLPVGFSLSKGQTNVGLTFDKPCMLKIVNSTEKIYVRYGVNANSGTNKYELILVDENGNVDPSTPIQYDYTTVTDLVVYCATDTPISVGNGTITTIAPNPKEYDPDYENNYCYYSRGIAVNRSNTTIYNIVHTIVGEDMTVEIDRDGDGIIEKWGDDKSYGVPYIGFFNFSGCSNVTLTDCTVQGHQAYSFYQGTSRNEMGSYDINASDCINLSLLNLTQYENEETGEVITNRFMYHGIMGSNFCRNIVMDNCYLDRFDSHQGLYNATITNSTLGFGILVIGGGDLYIENVYRVSGNEFILLREDYNSVFDGNLVIKNCKMGSSITSVIKGTWRSFDCGLPNYMFRSVTIEGLTVESSSTNIYVYNITNASKSALNDAVNKLYVPDSIKVTGVVRVSGASVSVKASKNSADAFSAIALSKD